VDRWYIVLKNEVATYNLFCFVSYECVAYVTILTDLTTSQTKLEAVTALLHKTSLVYKVL